MTLQALEERQSFLLSLKTFKDSLEKLTAHPHFKNTNEEFQDMIEDVQFELDLELKESE